MTRTLPMTLALIGSLTSLAPLAQGARLYTVNAPTVSGEPISTDDTGWESSPLKDGGSASYRFGYAEVSFPTDFHFPFYGVNQEKFYVLAQGLISFEAPSGTTWWNTTNGAANGQLLPFPRKDAPHSALALWWGDMTFGSSVLARDNSVKSKMTVASGDRVYTVVLKSWGYAHRSYQGTPVWERDVQVDFHESGKIVVTYGTANKTPLPPGVGGVPLDYADRPDTATNYGASIGLAGPKLADGHPTGTAALACANQGLTGTPGAARCRGFVAGSDESWAGLNGKRLTYTYSAKPEFRIAALDIVSVTPNREGSVLVSYKVVATAAIENWANDGVAASQNVKVNFFAGAGGVLATTQIAQLAPGATETTEAVTFNVPLAAFAIDSSNSRSYVVLNGEVNPAGAGQLDEEDKKNNKWVADVAAAPMKDRLYQGAALLVFDELVVPPVITFGEFIKISTRIKNVGIQPSPGDEVLMLDYYRSDAKVVKSKLDTIRIQQLAAGQSVPVNINNPSRYTISDADLPDCLSPGGSTVRVRLRLEGTSILHAPALSGAVVFKAAELGIYKKENDPEYPTGIKVFEAATSDITVPTLTSAYFGDRLRITWRARNWSDVNSSQVGTATDIRYGFYIQEALVANQAPPLNENAHRLVDCVEVNGANIIGYFSYPPSGDWERRTVECTLPLKNNELPFKESPEVEWYLGVRINAGTGVAELDASNNLGWQRIELRNPAMNLVAGSLVAPVAAGAGDSVSIERTITNIGNLGNLLGSELPAAKYAYALSANMILSQGADILLPILQPDETYALFSEVRLASKGKPGSTQTLLRDVVRIPTDVSPGKYYLALWLDPEREITELEKGDNISFAVGMLTVVEPGIQVVTAALPDAIKGVSYRHQLAATGGMSDYEWSLWSVFTGEPTEAPEGLSLDPATGVLSGVPTKVGTSTLGVRVTSRDRSALARLVLRVEEASAPMRVATTILPHAIVGDADYSFRLEAVGGVPFAGQNVAPYEWTLGAGSLLPKGLLLGKDGIISGTTAASAAADEGTTYLFSVTAVDSRGSSASGQVALQVFSSRSRLHITGISVNGKADEASLPIGKVGEKYCTPTSVCRITQLGGIGAVTWSITAGSLPPGVQLSGDGAISSDVALTESGIWQAAIRACDSKAMCDQLQVAIAVSENSQLGDLIILEPIRRCQSVNVELAQLAKGSGELPIGTWRQLGGNLPPGVSLNSGGLLAGTVPCDAAVADYGFVAELRFESGIKRVIPASLRVNGEPNLPVQDKSSGCGASGSGEPALLGLVALAAFAWLGRARLVRRAAPAAALALLAVALPAPAQARNPESGDYRAKVEPAPFEAIVGQPVPQVEQIPHGKVTLPFRFRLYDTEYSVAYMSCRGTLSFESATGSWSKDLTSVVGIPSTGTAFDSGVLAPYWMSKLRCDKGTATGDALTWEVQGKAPNRVVVFQWNDVYYSDDPPKTYGARFQVRLFELSNKIEFHYDYLNREVSATLPVPEGAGGKISIGIQGERKTSTPLGIPGLECARATSPTCRFQPSGVDDAACKSDYTKCTGFPAGLVIRFEQRPDVQLNSVRAAGIAQAGLPMHVSLSIKNRGGMAIPNNDVWMKLYLTSSATRPSSGAYSELLLGESLPVSMAIDQSRELEIEPTLPEDLGVGLWYLRGEVHNNLNQGPMATKEGDYDATNDKLAGIPFTVAPPAVDLVPGDISLVSGTLRPGQTVRLAASIKNIGRGALPATKLTYSWFLSEDETISLADRELSTRETASIALPSQGKIGIEDELTIPNDLRPGRFYVGLVVDSNAGPGEGVAELTKSNNGSAKGLLLEVDWSTLTLLSSALFDGYVGIPYNAWVEAAGGSGEYTFKLLPALGSLPAGLSLNADGEIFGLPVLPGDYAFTVQVASAGLTQQRQLTLKIGSAAIPLTLVDRALPRAVWGKPYTHTLTAVGGVPPYRWSLASGTLPEGLLLSSDGRLEGQLIQGVGADKLHFSVRDSAPTPAEASRELAVKVDSLPSSPSIVTRFIPDMHLGKESSYQLRAAGGTGVPEWKLESTRRVDEDPFAGEFQPSQLNLKVEQSGLLHAVAGAVGDFVVTVSYKQLEVDGTTVRAMTSASFTIRVHSDDGNIEFLTRSLPDAIVGKEYPALKLEMLLPATRDITISKFQLFCNGGQACELPPGIHFVESGKEAGTFSTNPGEVVGQLEAGLNSKAWTFGVKALDNRGRSAVTVLSLNVRTEPSLTSYSDSGCQSGGGKTPLAAILALALVGFFMLGNGLRRSRHGASRLER